MAVPPTPAIPAYVDDAHFGDSSFCIGKKRVWTNVTDLVHEFVKGAGENGVEVNLRGRVDSSRCKGKLGFLVLRDGGETVQCVIDANTIGETGKEMVKYVGHIPLESIVDIKGQAVAAYKEVTSCSRGLVEIRVDRITCISRALEQLPFYLKDANQKEDDKEDTIKVELVTRLDNRVLDLRTHVSRAIFKVQSEVCHLFREFLRANRFTEIHSPKLLGGASEGGSNCFTLDYFNKKACLAQSPQLYKQMAICADMERVFEIGPVFRAENSNTHRHLCEFTGLDLEMTFKEDYMEAVDFMMDMFDYIFEGLGESCKKEQEFICNHFNTTPFKFDKSKHLKMTYEEGMQLLRDDGFPDIPADVSEFDMGTEMERALGVIIKKKFDTDFYVLVDYPSAIRPFYTMPHPTKPGVSNSYDFFMRGEEIVSGAQRVHTPDMLEKQALKLGMEIAGIKDYIDSFRLGCPPHAGCGVGLERVVMLFLDVGNIRRCSMFPRDPKRIAP